MPESISFDAIGPPRYVPYMDLSGGLNTKKDPHALARNELAQSVNGWYGTGNAFSKRPGSIRFSGGLISNANLAPATGLAAARFGNVTYALAQQPYLAQSASVISYSVKGSGSFTAITFPPGSPYFSYTANPFNVAQMYDPETGKNTVFMVDGVDVPQTWYGPPNTNVQPVNSSGTHIPYNHTNSAPITPAYVTTAGFYLIYAGEPTEPTAVYISNPYYPQIFNTSATTTSGILPNPYIPYLVGFNDGVNGGNITGIQQLPDGSATGAVMIYKQSAVYRMNQVGFFGEMYWGETLVSASVGCTSPRSIVAFDTFHCFLGIDGVYQTDGASVRCISSNVPTYFDSSLNGNAALIQNRTTAIATRQGQRYLIWFDATGTGVCNTGLWFDFGRPGQDGLPTVGEIDGMSVSGLAPLRGPGDDGNFVWTSALVPYAYEFGVGFLDDAVPITTSFAGKADFFDDLFGPAAPIQLKSTDDVWLLLSAIALPVGETLTFTCSVVTDFGASGSTSGAYLPPSYGAVWGSAVYGVAIWSGTLNQQFVALKIPNQITAQGHSLQFAWSESSGNPWTVLGYIAYVNAQKVAV